MTPSQQIDDLLTRYQREIESRTFGIKMLLHLQASVAKLAPDDVERILGAIRLSAEGLPAPAVAPSEPVAEEAPTIVGVLEAPPPTPAVELVVDMPAPAVLPSSSKKARRPATGSMRYELIQLFARTGNTPQTIAELQVALGMHNRLATIVAALRYDNFWNDGDKLSRRLYRLTDEEYELARADLAA